MNAKQYERVLPYRINLQQAKSNYVRLCRSGVNTLREVYNEVFKKDMKVGQMGCNTCVLRMLRELCEAVEKYEAWREKFKKKEENNEGEVVEGE